MVWGLSLDYCDLHLHSKYSDGKLSIVELFELANELSIKAVSIVDHDTFKGQCEAIDNASGYNIEYITGVEVSTLYNNTEIHIIGYGMNIYNKKLTALFNEMQKKRVLRAIKILEKLQKYGIFIDVEEIDDNYMNKNIGRAHIARIIERRGYLSYKEAFKRYLYNNGPCYEPKMEILPKMAIEYIHEAGGIAVLAHPGIALPYEYIDIMIDMGINGIEVYYPKHSEQKKHDFLEIVRRSDLVATGGSDFHGNKNDYKIIKNHKVDYDVYIKLKRYYDNRKYNEEIKYKQ